jgi:subtilisin-like proprotein convertase family protein
VQSGWQQLSPFFHSVSLSGGATATGRNLPNCRLNSVAGNVFKDNDADGVRDVGDDGIASRRVFIDTNANGLYDFGSVMRTASDVPKSITDFSTVSSSVTVSGFIGLIKDLNVNLSISHTYDGDLRIYLVAPNGRRIELARNLGGGGDNFANTTFDDEAGAAITSGAPPYSGFFRPQSPLFAVDGISPNGTWKLEIKDTASGDVGTLTSWALIIGYAEASALSNAAGDYSIGNLPAGSFRLDEVVPTGWFMTTPSAGYFPLTLGSGTTLTGKSFGNAPVPSAIN